MAGQDLIFGGGKGLCAVFFSNSTGLIGRKAISIVLLVLCSLATPT